jgi:pantoate--beta-alanine ligase
MKVVKTIVELQTVLAQEKQENKSIGLTPTMGALHQGHIELVKQCVAENEVSVVSIFVNPTQFNDKNDLLKYPRTLEADCELLQPTGNKLVFAPAVEEIYPEPDTRQFGFGNLETVMEGRFRPGHFNGVAQVVSRLFDIVKPDKAYFGEKDFQQLAIIHALVKQLGMNIQIVPHPIVREPGGLAMSSRNSRLTPEQRKNACGISEALFESRDGKKQRPVAGIKKEVIDKINRIPGFQVEYFELVDRDTLQAVSSWKDSEHIVGCIAVYAGEIRLIDNIAY